MKKNLNIVLIGPQGSGKGTQGEMLSEFLGVPMVVTGDVYRAHIRLGTFIGGMARSTIDRGELMPDDVTRQLMDQELSHIDRDGGVIVDGYPRNEKQAEDLDNMLDVDYLISLHIPDEVTVERISNRRSCPNGHVYNLISNPPQKEGVCDEDGKELYVRTDDKEGAIKRRLEIFHTETEPVLDYFKKQGKLIEIDATGSIDDVHKTIVERLKALDE